MTPFPHEAVCGDSIIQLGEDCDDGSRNGSVNACCTAECQFSTKGPDVIVGDITGTKRHGTLNGVTAYSIGASACNIGTCWLNWIEHTPDHPVIAQNMFRLKDGRFEQIGQSWLKHGLAAAQFSTCATPENPCRPSPTFEHLGVMCSDPYDSSLNGEQVFLGPKADVNPSSGVFRYPDSRIGTTGNVLFKRLQVNNLDLNPSLNAGALYFLEVQYVARDDARAGNQRNNVSWRRVAVSPTAYALALQDSTVREEPAIKAWKANDPSVVETSIRADGLFVMAAKVTPLGGGQYSYEYAVQNLNSHRGARSFSVPLPPEAIVTSTGFHDVSYHSGEPFVGIDWAVVVTPTAVTWSTDAYEAQSNANALRWGTLYNFRFEANLPPGSSLVTLGLFRPGTPASRDAVTLGPVSPVP